MTVHEPPPRHPPRKIREDWQPTAGTVAFVRSEFPKVDHQRSHGRFVTYHVGKGDKSESWDAAFRLWVEQDADKITDHREGGTDYKGLPNDSADEWTKYLMGRDG